MNPNAFTAPFGEMSGRNIIGEVTEAIKAFVVSGWTDESNFDIKEKLDDIPIGQTEQFAYVYMYRLAQNPNLQNRKRLRQAPVFLNDSEGEGNVYYHRPPLMIDLFYLITVHSRFPSDAAKLLGWLLLRLNEATHLIYRPRKFLLPDGREIDSLGRDYDPNVVDEDNLIMEKVSLALVDDLNVGDAINLFSLHEAPYRPFLTYRARVAIDGPLVHAPSGTTVQMPRLERAPENSDRTTRPNGRPIARGRLPKMSTPPGPKPTNFGRDYEPDNED